MVMHTPGKLLEFIPSDIISGAVLGWNSKC